MGMMDAISTKFGGFVPQGIKGWSGFDDSARELIEIDPQLNTLSSHITFGFNAANTFKSLFTAFHGGYCFYIDPATMRLIPYDYSRNDCQGRWTYVYDRDTKTFWSPGYKPATIGLDEFETRLGMGYLRTHSKKDGIAVDVMMMVPLHDDCEIHSITVRNDSKSSRTIDLSNYLEFCGYDIEGHINNYQRTGNTAEVEVFFHNGSQVILNKAEYAHGWRKHYTYSIALDSKPDSFTTNRDSFLGVHGNSTRPDSVVNNTQLDGYVTYGDRAAAARKYTITLQPGESKELNFLFGIAHVKGDKFDPMDQNKVNRTPVKEVVEKYMAPKVIEKEFKNLKAYWDERLSHMELESGDPALDRLVKWNQFQCWVTYNMSRSTSLYEAGKGRGLGFRDSLQDLMGYVHYAPAEAKERILDIASTQFRDGGNFHQYTPLEKKGNAAVGGDFFDDPMWMMLAINAYIKETGDWTILDEMVPYSETDGSKTTDKFTLHEHLRVSFEHVIGNLGPHKLPLVGRADWNDCLNLNLDTKKPVSSFQTGPLYADPKKTKAESVLVAQLYVFMGREYVKLCMQLGNIEEAESMEKNVEAMIQAIEKDGWDGKWFRRAFDRHGNPIGSDKNETAKIWIETQGWGLLTAIGKDKGWTQTTAESVEQHLASEYGVRLLWPYISEYNPEMGEVSAYPPAHKENGGVFAHNNPWVIRGLLANRELNDSYIDRAWTYFKRVSPILFSQNDPEKAKSFSADINVYCQVISGPEVPDSGKGRNSWLTGTSAWMWNTLAEGFLGIQPEYHGLRIDPSLPAEVIESAKKSQKDIKVRRDFRGTRFDIAIVNPQDKQYGVKQMMVDDEIVNGNVIPEKYMDKKHHKVRVIL